MECDVIHDDNLSGTQFWKDNFFQPNGKIVNIRIIIEVKRRYDFPPTDPCDNFRPPMVGSSAFFFDDFNSFFRLGIFLDVLIISAGFIYENKIFYLLCAKEFRECSPLFFVPLLV
jgi:hypothetical protein